MRYIYIILGLLFLAGVVHSYTVIDNNVIQKDAFSKILVYPHTSNSPGNVFSHFFELTNKTGSQQEIYAGYKFDTAIQSGKIYRYNEPIFGWVERFFNDCNPPYKYVYLINNNPSQNPHWVKCFRTMSPDINFGFDYNIVKFDSNFSSGNFDTNTINKKFYEKVSGDDFTDFSSLMTHTDYLNDAYYYLNSTVTFQPGETKKWKIEYTPGASDLTGKWELVYFRGATKHCIIDGSCDYVQWLDPWWDTDWNYSKIISIASVDALDQNFTAVLNLDTQALVSAGKMKADCDDLRIIFQTTTDVDRQIRGCNGTDTNVLFKLQNTVQASTTDTNYVLYYGNSVATSPPDNNNFVFRINETFANLNNWTRTWSEDSGELQAGTLHLNKDNGTTTPANREGYCFTGDGNTFKNFVLEFDANGTSYASNFVFDYNGNTGIGQGSPDSNYSAFYQMNKTTATYILDANHENTVVSTQIIGVNWVASDWNHFKVEYRGSTGDINVYQGNRLMNFYNNLISGQTRESGTICFNAHGNVADSSNLFIRRVQLRSTVVNEPTITLGAENLKVTIIINQPQDGNYISQNRLGVDANTSIEFTIQSFDSNHLLLDLNYNSSSTIGGTPIYADLNITNLAPNGSERTPQLQCDSNDFTSPVLCKISWNVLNVADGNWFLSFNVKYDFNQSAFSNSFVVDNNKASTSWDGNHNIWQNMDANIHLTCVDAIDCNNRDKNITYRLDSDSSSAISYGVWLVYDTNILVSADGNWAIDFNSTDSAGNIGDVNTFYVLLDSTNPVIANSLPLVDIEQSNTDFTFVIDVTETGSGTQYCDWNALKDGSIYLTNMVAVVSGGQCTATFNYAIFGTSLSVQWDANDLAGNSATNINSFSIKLTNPGGGATGVAGGPGGGLAYCAEEKGHCNFNRDCCSPLICVEGLCTDIGVITERIIEVDLSTSVMNVLPDQNRELIVTVLNKTDKVFFIEVSVDENLSKYLVFQGENQKVSLNEYERKRFVFSVIGIDENFIGMQGIITVNANIRQEIHEKNFRLTTGEENPLFAFLGFALLGENVTVGLVILILVIAGIVFSQIRKRQKNV